MKKIFLIFIINLLLLTSCSSKDKANNSNDLSIDEQLQNLYGFTLFLPSEKTNEKIINQNYSFTTYEYNSIDEVKIYMNNFFTDMINNNNVKVVAHSIYSNNFCILKTSDKLSDYNNYAFNEKFELVTMDYFTNGITKYTTTFRLYYSLIDVTNITMINDIIDITLNFYYITSKEAYCSFEFLKTNSSETTYYDIS